MCVCVWGCSCARLEDLVYAKKKTAQKIAAHGPLSYASVPGNDSIRVAALQ